MRAPSHPWRDSTRSPAETGRRTYVPSARAHSSCAQTYGRMCAIAPKRKRSRSSPIRKHTSTCSRSCRSCVRCSRSANAWSSTAASYRSCSVSRGRPSWRPPSWRASFGAGETTVNDVDRLFRTYHDPLVRYLTRRLGDRDWAEEVAQETFLRALKQDHIASERAWLFAVATNLVRDDARRDAWRKRRLELLREQAKIDDVVEPEPLTIERAEEAMLARRALETLGERDREALLMREEGLDYTEIAAALELSVGSVGTTLSRARRRLVEAYESLTGGANERDRGTHAAS